MKTLIIHHLQFMWDSGLQGFGTSFDEQLEKVCEHLDQNTYDSIIVTNFEAGFDLDEEQMPLLNYCLPELYSYEYGWCYEGLDITEEQKEKIEKGELVKSNYDEYFCLGGQHSEVVLVPEWMMNIEGDIYICGAFDGECIEDLEIALQNANKEFKRIETLIT